MTSTSWKTSNLRGTLASHIALEPESGLESLCIIVKHWSFLSKRNCENGSFILAARSSIHHRPPTHIPSNIHPSVYHLLPDNHCPPTYPSTFHLPLSYHQPTCPPFTHHVPPSIPLRHPSLVLGHGLIAPIGSHYHLSSLLGTVPI